LSEWLAYLPIEQGVAVERAGSKYAIQNGSGVTWLQFCQKLLKTPLTDSERSNVLWTSTYGAERCGDLDTAYSFAEEKAQLDQAHGKEYGFAIAKGQIADILEKQGNLEEANHLLCLALAAARKIRIPQEQQIERILQRFEMDCLNLNSHN
jgi:hypothetical protein